MLQGCLAHKKQREVPLQGYLAHKKQTVAAERSRTRREGGVLELVVAFEGFGAGTRLLLLRLGFRMFRVQGVYGSGCLPPATRSELYRGFGPYRGFIFGY